MKIKALTSDGTWWRLSLKANASKEKFVRDWNRSNDSDLFFTTGDEIALQKRNIVAIMFEE